MARSVARRILVSLVAILFGDEADRREWADDYVSTGETETGPETTSTESATDTRDVLETLRERYAAGEVTDE